MRSSSESEENSLENRKRNRRGLKTMARLSPRAKWEQGVSGLERSSEYSAYHTKQA